MNPIFITGSTGYLGVPLIQALRAKGYAVHALVRSQSVQRLPRGALLQTAGVDTCYARGSAAAGDGDAGRDGCGAG